MGSRSTTHQLSLLELTPQLYPLVPPEKRPFIVVPDTPSLLPSPVRDDVRRLRETLAARGTSSLLSGSELISTVAKNREENPFVTSIPSLDRLLGGGLPRGMLIELEGSRTSGRFAIVLAILAAATTRGEAAALVDLGDHLDPAAAEAAGVVLERLLWIRPLKLKEAVSAAEMVIQTGFQLVILDLGLPPLPGRKVSDASWLRLARGAQAQATALLLSTPYPVSRSGAAEALLKAGRTGVKWLGKGTMPRLLGGISSVIEVEKFRRHKAGELTRGEWTARW